jgi:glyoxylase-like metal-dependent hydrolase (beta-lactamase superfamily II)
MPFQEIEHLAPNVWRFPQGLHPAIPQPNVGIIRDTNRTILIDAGNGIRHARMIHGELVASGFPPVGMIIYTHHHWDHVFGAMMFPSATIVAHDLCAVQLRQMASRPWNPSSLRDEAQRNPQVQARNHAMLQAMEDWRDFRICYPHITFSKRFTLHLHNGTRLELQHMVGSHAADSITVAVPEAGIMFLGDGMYPPVAYDQTDNVTTPNLSWANFISEQYQLYVEGHSNPVSYAALRSRIETDSANHHHNTH